MKGDTEDGLGRGEDDVLDSHDATRFEDVVSRQDVRVEDEVVGLIPVVSLASISAPRKRGVEVVVLEKYLRLWLALGEQLGG